MQACFGDLNASTHRPLKPTKNVPDNEQQTRTVKQFEPLSVESFDELDASLSEHFDRVLAPGGTKSFSAGALEKHYDGVKNRKSEAETLTKALDEIAVRSSLY